jgi:lantibiotic modifying enzyme
MNPSNTDIFFEIAQNIGTRLCQHAFWHDSRCNWVGKSLDELIENGPPTNKALSPEIYEGTSGIAIFLSDLYIQGNNKHDEYRRTAEGAINQALSRLDDLSQIPRFGLFSGQVGVAYAATIIGKKFDNQELIESALQIVQRLGNDKREDHLLDIISGVAGAIPALLKIHEITNDNKALVLAMDLGEKLISAAVKEPYGWSWDYKGSGLRSASHNLTGFSHGAAGIGYALMELYNITGKKEWLYATESAFQYENHWFSDHNENWPDFRLDDENDNYQQNAAFTILKQEKKEENLKFAVAWCHGAPGIALSRLRAYQLLKNERYLKDIRAALRTTMQVVKGIGDKDTSIQHSNFSLCHGLAGIGEILLYAGQVLNDETYKSLAIDIGRYGIEKYAKQSLPWPCDARIGETLGLMIGISGIGNFYLRLSHPDSVHSPLIIT